jgi:hypothetical protein
MTQGEMQLYDYVVELGIATSDELNLVKDVAGGTWVDIINSVIYARTGYRSIDQYIEYEME